jgi:hypothetical protein
VEVLRRYSNRPDLLDPLRDVLQRIEAGDQQDEPGVCSTGHGGGLRPVRERLSEVELRELVANREAGKPLNALVTQYGISLSSVKRVLRRAGCYRPRT